MDRAGTGLFRSCQAKGFQVLAVQIPLTSVEDDLAATNRIVGDAKGPIVLVGHSWGGMAVTQAGRGPSDASGALYHRHRQRGICVSD